MNNEVKASLLTPQAFPEDQQPSVSSLPHPILSHIFSFCQERFEPRIIGDEELVAKPLIRLSQVCKLFQEAADSDDLWKPVTLFAMNKVKGTLRYVMCDSQTSILRRNNVYVTEHDEPGLKQGLPSRDFKQSYIRLKRAQWKKMQAARKVLDYQNTFCRRVYPLQLKFGKILNISSMAVTILLIMQCIAMTLHQATSKFAVQVPREYYLLTFAPVYTILLILVILFIMNLLIDFKWAYTTVRRELSVTFGFSKVLPKNIVPCFFLAAFIIMVLGTVLNLGVLPHLYTVFHADPQTWDRRVHLIPWFFLWSPVTIITPAIGSLVIGFFGISILFSREIFTRICKFALLLAPPCIGFTSIWLICFHLEAPTRLHIAYCFIPLHIATGVKIIESLFALKRKPRLENGTWVFLYFSLEFTWILMSCIETVIGPFCWLSFIPPLLLLNRKSPPVETGSYTDAHHLLNSGGEL